MSPRGMSAYYYVQPPHQSSPSLMGYEDLASPGVALHRMLRQQRAMQGLGQNGEPTPPTTVPNGNGAAVAAGLGLTAGMLVAVAALAVAVNYQIGKAMAPDKTSESKWAWGLGIGGTLLPPLLPIAAIYKNYFR